MPTASPAAIARAVLWMSGALTSLTLLAFATRELTHEMGTSQIVFLRCAVGLVILLPFIARLGLRSIRTGNFRLQLLRNALHFGGSWCWYYGVALLPLAQVFALEFTSPVWLGIIAVLLLGERLSFARAAAIGLGFLGILVIVRPGIVEISAVVLIVLASAIGFGASHACVKKLTITDSSMAVLFYMSLLQLPMAAVPTLFDWSPVSWLGWGWVAVIAACNTFGHFCFAQALRLADATVVIPIDFLRLPLVAVGSWLVYAEAIDPFVLIGAAIIFAGNYNNIRSERRAAERREAAAPGR
jgi:drug/metabolite transporter (DMT)-like permease